MKKLILLPLLFLYSSQTDYQYEIVGKVLYNDSLRDAVWYTDTISFDEDTVYYFNSDGSEVRIYPPYIIKEY